MLEDDNRAALEQLLSELIEKPLKEIQAKQLTPQLNKIANNLNGLSTALRSGEESVLEVSTEIRELDKEVLAEAGKATQILSELRDQQAQGTDTVKEMLARLEARSASLEAARVADMVTIRAALISLGDRLASIQQEQAAVLVVSRKAQTDLQTLMADAQQDRTVLQTTMEAVIKRQEASSAERAALRRHVSLCASLLGLLVVVATAMIATTRHWP